MTDGNSGPHQRRKSTRNGKSGKYRCCPLPLFKKISFKYNELLKAKVIMAFFRCRGVKGRTPLREGCWRAWECAAGGVFLERKWHTWKWHVTVDCDKENNLL